MLHDFEVGIQSHIYEIRLKFDYFQKSSQKIIDAAITNEILKLIEDLVHSPQKDFSIPWKSLDQKQSLLDQVSFLCLLSRFLYQNDDLIQDMLSILFISNQDKQPNGLISQSDVVWVQTFNQHYLPAI